MRVNNSSSSANEQCSSLPAGARPAHRAPRSQQHVPQPWDLQLQSRALAAERDEAVGRLLAAVSFPLVRPPAGCWLSTTIVTEHRGASTWHQRAVGAAGSAIAPRGMPLAEPRRVPAQTSPGSVLSTPVEKPGLFLQTWQAQLHHLQGELEPPHASLPEGPKLCRCGAGRRMQCCCLGAAHTRQRTAGGLMSPAHHQLDTNTARGGSLTPLHLPRQPPSQGQALEPEPRAPPFPFLHPPGAVRIVLLYTFLRVAVLFC